jgi:hypothetical protein
MKIKTNRTFIIDHKFEDVDSIIKFHFKIPASEDVDYTELRKKLYAGDEIKTEDTKTPGAYNAYLYSLRTALVKCEGIEDENGKPIIITDNDGVINEDYQIAVFELIKFDTELMKKVVVAYTGVSEKNF